MNSLTWQQIHVEENEFVHVALNILQPPQIHLHARQIPPATGEFLLLSMNLPGTHVNYFGRNQEFSLGVSKFRRYQ
jgi:hypothetical protein